MSRAHLRGCAKCRVELRWRELESALAQRRAATDELGGEERRTKGGLARWAASAAVAVAVVAVLISVGQPVHAPPREADQLTCQQSSQTANVLRVEFQCGMQCAAQPPEPAGPEAFPALPELSGGGEACMGPSR